MRLARIPVVVLAFLAAFACKSNDSEPESDPATETAAEPAAEPTPAPAVVEPAPFVPGTAIVICGQRFDIGTPVVLWSDPGGYSAYATDFNPDHPPENVDPETGLRYTPGRRERGGDDAKELVPADCDDVTLLATAVDQFVLHYDAAATSQRCFEILQDVRGLSVHFMLDVDGTIYQTLDCREQAWHASKANARSIGVEIAQIGAFSPPEVKQLEKWYARDKHGPYLKLPDGWGDGGIRTKGFVARPRVKERISGVIQGRPYSQYDYTPEQYAALTKLVARLTRELPRIRIDVPRGADRRPTTHVMSEPEYEAFTGILGHYHLTAEKIDPGPVFEFEPFLIAVRREQAKLPIQIPSARR